ncbi:hypothetical protein [Fastidiosibacter lacustris]|uniref:hypothetical protein n=1 Tax=Fastidiosibacter lacustris TaxID=2056695 RepID=UPI000E348A04|nr:hypothetical protein [Fastidiosibacter lacustris]
MKKLVLVLGLAAASTTIFATGYQVYSEPNKNSQVISQLTDQNQNQYIQFYQQDDWVKVANTQTGAVGWVDTAKMQQSQAKYQNAINALTAEQKQLEAQRQLFEQNYQQAVSHLQQKVQRLQQQMNAKTEQPIPNVQVNDQPVVQNQTQTNIQRSFNAISIKTNSDGKTATVTKEWLGNDGKIHKETKQVTLSDLQNTSLNF